MSFSFSLDASTTLYVFEHLHVLYHETIDRTRAETGRPRRKIETYEYPMHLSMFRDPRDGSEKSGIVREAIIVMFDED
jgi:hypothetical protein